MRNNLKIKSSEAFKMRKVKKGEEDNAVVMTVG